MLTIEEVRTKTCLMGFRCGFGEIEQFCKTAFEKHTKADPDYRVRVLYEDGNAIGMHTMSLKLPEQNRTVLDKKSVHVGNKAFLYLDHFAVCSGRQGEGHSYPLMTDIFAIASQTIARFGRISGLALNAGHEKAVTFFSDWGFNSVSDSAQPFMVMDRPDVMRAYQELST